ncbi:MAG TPA: hypothetical protein VF591_26455 [Pyrinomonadaceae bacterium]|jgi:hypothetical protein
MLRRLLHTPRRPYSLINICLLAAFTQAQTTAVDSAKLARLLERGRETNSDAVIVTQDGKALAEEYYGKPVAVRVVRNGAGYRRETDVFQDFLQLAAGLAGREVSAPPVR